MFSFAGYTGFVKNHTRFLGFGFLLAFVSSAGQTHFIGIFGPEIRATFGLSHTNWGLLYMLGTLSSALVLPWSGQLIDRIDLRWYTAFVVCGLALACVTVSLSSSLIALTFAIFMLRQFGQGLVSHTSVTSMARYMSADRGKAIAISAMGYSVGESVLPFLAVFAIVAIGWRGSYLFTAVCVLLMLPIILRLLKGHDGRHTAYVEQLASQASSSGSLAASKTRGQMLTEGRFYLLLPAILMPSYIVTGLFFHHLTLAQSKGWSELWVTGNYWVYALMSIVTSLVIGPLLDRYSAVRVIPFYLTPMFVGLLLLVPAQHKGWVIVYMMFIGMNTGIYFTAISSLWAELYGVKHLGGIKSLVGAFSVFASALGPVTIGALLDYGYRFEQICIVFAVFCAISTVLLIVGLRQFKPG